MGAIGVSSASWNCSSPVLLRGVPHAPPRRCSSHTSPHAAQRRLGARLRQRWHRSSRRPMRPGEVRRRASRTRNSCSGTVAREKSSRSASDRRAVAPDPRISAISPRRRRPRRWTVALLAAAAPALASRSTPKPIPERPCGNLPGEILHTGLDLLRRQRAQARRQLAHLCQARGSGAHALRGLNEIEEQRHGAEPMRRLRMIRNLHFEGRAAADGVAGLTIHPDMLIF